MGQCIISVFPINQINTFHTFSFLCGKFGVVGCN